MSEQARTTMVWVLISLVELIQHLVWSTQVPPWQLVVVPTVGGLVVDRLIALPQRGMQAASGEGAAMTAETADMAAESAAEPSLLPLAELGGWLTPGALFALGGAFALAIVLLVLVVNRYR